MPDPVSWFLIEPGWKVDDASGVEVGRVEEVLGDSNADIFDGLAIALGALRHPRYVASEVVASIVEGRVGLSLDATAIDALSEYREAPEQIRIEPEKSSRLERLESVLAPRVERPERIGLVRRVLEWLGVAGKR